MSHDSGRLINPTIVEGQIQGAVALGLGSALLEEVRYDTQGQPLAGSYMDYAMSRADDFPAIVIDHLETPSPLNPLGLKGVGESGTLPVAAVIASAVEDALAERGCGWSRCRSRRMCCGGCGVPDRPRPAAHRSRRCFRSFLASS